jgi:hypothetical protein
MVRHQSKSTRAPLGDFAEIIDKEPPLKGRAGRPAKKGTGSHEENSGNFMAL